MIGFLAGVLLWMILDHELPNGVKLKAISLYFFDRYRDNDNELLRLQVH